ncbi:NAD(P)H-dependent oxidoreductase [Candidatus Peregrinibacteria bacterium]|jgi:nitroreductase|nr:NAD(P)H-dependent oxidoreductase [Candidatus Peregrinibacteria bacterium]
MNILESLNWRYAVKLFDPEKHISDADFENVLEALRLSPSSFGLQPWKFIVVKDAALREQLKEHSWNQPQIVDASHMIVLCMRTDIDANYIEKYIEDMAETREVPVETLDGYKNKMIGFLEEKKKAGEAENWGARQLYIALGNLLTSAATMGIDACPMEGFDKGKYDEMLGLADKNLTAIAVCTLGYRSADDKYATAKKIRFSKEEVVEEI